MCFETAMSMNFKILFKIFSKTFKCGDSTAPYIAWGSGDKRYSF